MADGSVAVDEYVVVASPREEALALEARIGVWAHARRVLLGEPGEGWVAVHEEKRRFFGPDPVPVSKPRVTRKESKTFPNRTVTNRH